MRAVPETGDTTPTTFMLNATAESAGWTITFPNREPVPTRVIAIAGDSLVIETGPYQSARHPGVNATTRDVYRMVGDRLVGIAVARYATTGPDSLVRMRVEDIRVP
jgi:hypothetical protein